MRQNRYNVSIYDNNGLLANSDVTFDKEELMTTLMIPKDESTIGRIEIDDKQGLDYDNRFFFTLGQKPKVKVQVINNGDDGFLKKIYTSDEFILDSNPLSLLDYNTLTNHDVIVLNELEEITAALSIAIIDFVQNGGSLIVIPSLNSDINSYNDCLKKLNTPRLLSASNNETYLNKISFQHQLFQNAFYKEVSNFNYPKVNSHYQLLIQMWHLD